MRFVQFRYKSAVGKSNLGVQVQDQIVDLVEIGVNNLIDFIKGGNEAIEKAKRLVFVDNFNLLNIFRVQISIQIHYRSVELYLAWFYYRAVSSGKFRVPVGEVKLVSPVTNPDKVICIGMNYKDHCEEQGAPVPKEPIVFNKFPSSIIGDGDPIPYPECTDVSTNLI